MRQQRVTFHKLCLQGLYSLTGRAISEPETTIQSENWISMADTHFQNTPKCLKSGARSRIRTNDLLITNQLLCQLSYAGIQEDSKSDFTCPRLKPQ
jgi:hypothetical protein